MRRSLQLLSIVIFLMIVFTVEKQINAHLSRLRRTISITMPGTHFCGPGNFSGDPNDLGWLEDTDRCCRDHDLCPEYIDSGDVSDVNRGNLRNDDSMSRFHCDCDNQFYHCLKDNIDNDKCVRSSTVILYTYFTLTRVKCFKKEYPIISCKTFDEYSKDRCIVYYVNESLPQIYQWFDTLSTVVRST